jgi:hypothetical protein
MGLWGDFHEFDQAMKRRQAAVIWQPRLRLSPTLNLGGSSIENEFAAAA